MLIRAATSTLLVVDIQERLGPGSRSPGFLAQPAIHLDRKLAERRIFPGVDIDRSGTRREELLLSESTLKQVWLLRRMVGMLTSTSGSMNSNEATEKVLERLRRTKNNKEFLETLGKDT